MECLDPVHHLCQWLETRGLHGGAHRDTVPVPGKSKCAYCASEVNLLDDAYSIREGCVLCDTGLMCGFCKDPTHHDCPGLREYVDSDPSKVWRTHFGRKKDSECHKRSQVLEED